MRALRLAASALVLCLGTVSTSRATDCTPDTGQSSCFDADALWFRPGPARFVAIPPIPDRRGGSASLVASLSGKPVVAHARSPDPDGRDVPVVDTRLSANLLGSYAPLARLQLDAVLPVIAYQAGTGLTGVTDQAGNSLSSPVLGDFRIGAQYRLLQSSLRGPGRVALAARLDVVTPTGNQEQFAGGRGFTTAPTIVLGLDAGPLFLGTDVGVRLRKPVEFAGVQIGQELASGFGVGARFLDGRLSPAAEVHLLVGLSGDERATAGGGRISTLNAPAEWLLSLSSTPVPSVPVTLWVAGGGAIALSPERVTRPGGEQTTEYAAGLPSPAWRGLVGVRGTWGE